MARRWPRPASAACSQRRAASAAARTTSPRSSPPRRRAIARTLEIADRCTFSLDELRYEYPEELAPPGETPLEYLTRARPGKAPRERYPARHSRQGPRAARARTGADRRAALRGLLSHRVGPRALRPLARHPLPGARLGGQLGRLLLPGRHRRRSRASIDVLFERFISRERNEAPDIDVDFEHERREEVLQYLYDKYGRERAGMTAEVITYRPRSAVARRGQGAGPVARPRRRAGQERSTATIATETKLAERCRDGGPRSRRRRSARQLIMLVERADRLSAASVAARRRHGHDARPAVRTGADRERRHGRTAPSSSGTRTISTSSASSRSIACALGMLTAIRKCFDLVEQHHGRRAARWPRFRPEDPAVYDMICRADTIGVFQIESRAQMSMLPRLQPREFYDLVIEVAIVRPGPIQGNMVHPYLRRRAGEEPVDVSQRSEFAQVLDKTLGVPIFQEQAMQLAVVAAGFTPGEADQLRRAMAAWRRPGVIDQFREKLLDGMLANGLSRRVRRAASSSRSAASASTAFPSRTPPASRCWSTCRPG